MKKYEFTGETKTIGATTLHRIRAIKGYGKIKAGDLGGWVEKEETLSQDGSAWVYGDACVYGGTWEKPPLYIQGTKYPFNVSSPDTIQCGCQNHTFQEWAQKYQEIAREHGAESIVSEYVEYFNLACKMYGHEDCIIKRMPLQA